MLMSSNHEFAEANWSANTIMADELKRELDRLGVFAEYEDRFLDLFKPGDKS